MVSNNYLWQCARKMGIVNFICQVYSMEDWQPPGFLAERKLYVTREKRLTRGGRRKQVGK
jgi:hypothetical protein